MGVIPLQNFIYIGAGEGGVCGSPFSKEYGDLADDEILVSPYEFFKGIYDAEDGAYWNTARARIMNQFIVWQKQFKGQVRVSSAACGAFALQQVARNFSNSLTRHSHPGEHDRHGSSAAEPAEPTARATTAAREADETHVQGVSSKARRTGARSDSSTGCAVWDRHPPRSRKDLVDSG